MAVTTTYGYKKPQAPDHGDTFFPALEFNIDRVDQHKHDGIDSQKIAPENLTRTTQTVVAASWVAVAGQPGTYRQLVTMPGALLYDSQLMKFILNSGTDAGAQFFPSIVKATSNTFYLYINDNTVDVKIVYG